MRGGIVSKQDGMMGNNAQLAQRRSDAVPQGIASATPIFAQRAHNAELWDVEGNRYIDFAAGYCGAQHRSQSPHVG